MNTIIYKVEGYTGRSIGSGFMARVGVQVTAYNTLTGKRTYAFGKSPCYKFPCGAAHYRTGASAETRQRLNDAHKEAAEMAARLNSIQ